MKKSELDPQQIRHCIRSGPSHTGPVDSSRKKVRQFMSLIDLLTATEKQVLSGCLHMRPIQWHLKRHWHVPEVLEKVIPVPPSLHPHLDWWLD